MTEREREIRKRSCNNQESEMRKEGKIVKLERMEETKKGERN